MKTTILLILLSLASMFSDKEKNSETIPENYSDFNKEKILEDQCKYVFTTNWEKVEVEVRSGNQYNCTEREYVDSFILYKDEKRVLYADGQLCYRRKARPSDPASHWANWTSSVMCAFDRDIDIQVR